MSEAPLLPRHVQYAGSLGLAGIVVAALFIFGGIALFGSFISMALLAITLHEHHALKAAPFEAGALIALAFTGAFGTGVLLSKWKAISSIAGLATTLLVLVAAKSPTVLVAAALAAIVAAAVTTMVLAVLAARRGVPAALRRIRTSSFAAGVSAAAGLLLPLIAIPLFLVLAIPLIGTHVVITTTVNLPERGGPTSTSLAILTWFAEASIGEPTEDEEIAAKWALSSDDFSGGGEGASTTNDCFRTLTTPRAFGRLRGSAYMDAMNELKRWLSPDDAYDAVAAALIDVCTAELALDDDRLRAYFFATARNNARDFFRVPSVTKDADLRCPNVSADELIETREFARVVASARLSLSDRENQVLTAWASERSFTKTAKALGVSRSQGHREFKAALDRLMRILAARGCPVRRSTQVRSVP